jgi:hypothetical protein
VVGINQFTFAFGPSLVGIPRDRAGTRHGGPRRVRRAASGRPP